MINFNKSQRKILLSFAENFAMESHYPRIDKQKISSILDLAGLGVNNEELERILTYLFKKFLNTFGYGFDISIKTNFEIMVLFITLDAMGHFKKTWNIQSNLQAIIEEFKSWVNSSKNLERENYQKIIDQIRKNSATNKMTIFKAKCLFFVLNILKNNENENKNIKIYLSQNLQ